MSFQTISSINYALICLLIYMSSFYANQVNYNSQKE
jgi:hypothetical protein